MKRRWRLILMVVALSGVLAAVTYHTRELSYNGRSLSSWLLDLNYHVVVEDRTPAENAIRHFGTNALPHLLKQLRRKDTAWRSKMMLWNERLSTRFHRELFHLTPADGFRSGATQAIGVLGTQAASAIPELVTNLGDSELAGDSARALSLIGAPALPAILKAAHSSEWCVRWSAAFALEAFTNQPPEAVNALIVLAGDSQAEVRQSAAETIGNLLPQPARCVPLLGTMLTDTNPAVRGVACQAVVNFGTNAYFAVIGLSNAMADPVLAPTAGRALRQIGLKATPIVLGLLSHPDDKVRLEAISMIGGLRRLGTNCVTPLLPLLHDPKAKVRERAVSAIGSARAAATNFVSELLPLLQDSDQQVRINTIMALRVIPADPKPFLPVMLEALQKEADESVRESFLVAFQQFGENAKVAVPMLVELFRKQNEDQRVTILVPLAAVDPEAARSLGAEDWFLEMARTNAARLRAVFRPATTNRTEP